MKRVLFIPLVIVCYIMIDLAVRYICTVSYSNIPVESISYRSYQYELNNQTTDLLIVGASCGIHGYNPNLLSDSLNCKVVNASMDGQPICHQCITAKKFIANGGLKTIIIDIAAPQLEDYWDKSIDIYKPFYWTNIDARDYVNCVRPWYECLFMLSACYQYNGSFLSIVRNSISLDKRGKDGWLPIPYTGKPFVCEEKMSMDPIHPDSLNLEYLDNLINVCKMQDIRLILCKSPGLTGSQTFIDYMTVYASQHDIEFWDYNKVSGISDDHTLFKDEVHLNEKGADIFSVIIAKRIKGSVEVCN